MEIVILFRFVCNFCYRFFSYFSYFFAFCCIYILGIWRVCYKTRSNEIRLHVEDILFSYFAISTSINLLLFYYITSRRFHSQEIILLRSYKNYAFNIVYICICTYRLYGDRQKEKSVMFIRKPNTHVVHATQQQRY